MWIFASNGFVSIVADRKNPKTGDLLVRSRDKSHISNIFPQAEVFSKQPSDYRWRAWVPREQVIEAMISSISSINYDNFKNSIRDGKYHDACIGVWEEMYMAYHGR